MASRPIKCRMTGVESGAYCIDYLLPEGQLMKSLRLSALALILSIAPTFAQSLKPEAPSPLQPGINRSTVDNFVGTQYWYFMGGPGKTSVHVKFKAMELLGNPYKSDITVTLYDQQHTWKTPKVLSSTVEPVEFTFDGDIKKPTKIFISVAPPSGGLVRMGGEYQIEASGAVSYGQKSNADPIVGMYKQMSGYTNLLGDCKFNADGTVKTTSGVNGTWQLFDAASQTYVINVDGQERHSLQLMPGRGLVEGDSIVFQALQ
jgi:hypothetical protein